MVASPFLVYWYWVLGKLQLTTYTSLRPPPLKMCEKYYTLSKKRNALNKFGANKSVLGAEGMKKPLLRNWNSMCRISGRRGLVGIYISNISKMSRPVV